MRYTRLGDIIKGEIKSTFNRLGILSKKIDRLQHLEKANYGFEEDRIRNSSPDEKLEDIPEYHSLNNRSKTYARHNLDYIAFSHLLITLDQMVYADIGFPKEFYELLSIVSEEAEADKPFLVHEYFVQRKADKVAEKLEGYQKTLAEINEDPELNGFGKAFREAYKRLELELRDTHPKTYKMLLPELRPADAPFHPEIRKLIDEYIALPDEGKTEEDKKRIADKATDIRKQELEKYATKAMGIRTQEVILDALTRVYNEYKKGFE
jgi:hypothetical protein